MKKFSYNKSILILIQEWKTDSGNVHYDICGAFLDEEAAQKELKAFNKHRAKDEYFELIRTTLYETCESN